MSRDGSFELGIELASWRGPSVGKEERFWRSLRRSELFVASVINHLLIRGAGIPLGHDDDILPSLNSKDSPSDRPNRPSLTSLQA